MRKPFISEHFEFLDWQKCFDRLREVRKLHGDRVRLTVATKFYVSGYWIEHTTCKTHDGDFIYFGDEIDALEQRIIKEHEAAKEEDRGVLFTT